MFTIKLIQYGAINYGNSLHDTVLQLYQLKFILLFFGDIVVTNKFSHFRYTYTMKKHFKERLMTLFFRVAD